MSVRAFVDTNVLLHLFDAREAAKQERAAQLFESLGTDEYAPAVSTQVLQEAFVALTRKLSMDPREAMASLKMLDDAGFTTQNIGASMIWLAATRVIKEKLPFRDALIVEAALEAGCTVLFSEDLQDGRSFGALTVRNPFARP
jgi:predicted nucleic acid-binding protein